MDIKGYIKGVESGEISPDPEIEYDLMQEATPEGKELLIAHMRDQVAKTTARILAM